MEWYAVYCYDGVDGGEEIVFVEAVSDSQAESLAVEKLPQEGREWFANISVKVPKEVNSGGS